MKVTGYTNSFTCSFNDVKGYSVVDFANIGNTKTEAPKCKVLLGEDWFVDADYSGVRPNNNITEIKNGILDFSNGKGYNSDSSKSRSFCKFDHLKKLDIEIENYYSNGYFDFTEIPEIEELKLKFLSQKGSSVNMNASASAITTSLNKWKKCEVTIAENFGELTDFRWQICTFDNIFNLPSDFECTYFTPYTIWNANGAQNIIVNGTPKSVKVFGPNDDIQYIKYDGTTTTSEIIGPLEFYGEAYVPQYKIFKFDLKLPIATGCTVNLRSCPLDMDSLKYMVENSVNVGSTASQIAFSEETKGKSGFNTYAQQLRNMGYVIVD